MRVRTARRGSHTHGARRGRRRSALLPHTGVACIRIRGRGVRGRMTGSWAVQRRNRVRPVIFERYSSRCPNDRGCGGGERPWGGCWAALGACCSGTWPWACSRSTWAAVMLRLRRPLHHSEARRAAWTGCRVRSPRSGACCPPARRRAAAASVAAVGGRLCRLCRRGRRASSGGAE